MSANRVRVLIGVVLVAGCGSDVRNAGEVGDTREVTDAVSEAVEDSVPDVAPEVADDTVADANDVEDSEAPEADAAEDTVDTVDPDAPVLTEPGTFVTGVADLSEEYVFKSVWAGEPGRVVAVGNDGIVATQTREGSWNVLGVGQGVELLNGVHGDDKDRLFAVGIDGAIMEGGADALFTKLTIGFDETLWAVHALSERNAFAVGKGGVILHFDGERWGPSTGADASAVWNGITSAGDVVVLVGNGGKALIARGAGIEPVTTGVGANLHGVHTIDGEEFFAVGDQGTLLHGRDTSWQATDLGLVVSMRDVHGQSADDVYAVGYVGAVVHWNGSSWKLLEAPTTQNLLGVWVEDDGDVTIVGQDGSVFEGDRLAGFRETEMLFPGGELVDVWGTDDGSFLVAVGAQGKIFAREEGTWSEMTSPTSQGLEAVWGTHPLDVWAVGRSGYAAHWNGVEWLRADTPVTALIAAVWGDSESHYLAAGSGGTLLSWNGSSWESVASGTANNLRALASVGAEVWTSGAAGTILRFNGLGWGAAPIEGIPNAEGGEDPITEELLGIWMASAEDGWAVGDNGRILHWDGKRWNIVETEWTTALRGIYGVASNDVWAVGTAGHIIHWNGEEWEEVETETIATLYAIHGDGAEHVIVVGDLGTVLRLER